MKKIVSNLISSILIFIIATSSILIVYVAICTNDKSIFGFRIFSVISGSMSGAIEKGDFILTQKVGKENLQVGDIISFISSAPDIKGEVNTHRIVQIEGNTYHTKGDANSYIDKEIVKYEAIIGKVILHSSSIGKFILWAQKPKNMLCFIIFPVLIIAFCDFKKGYSLVKALFAKRKGQRYIIKKAIKMIRKRKRGRPKRKKVILKEFK